MKLSLLRGAAVAALAAAALFAAPAAASAQGNTDGYPATPQPGVTVTMPAVPAGTFLANERVSVILSGEDANFARANQAIVRAVYVDNANIGAVTSNAQGGLTYSITLPSTASGTYTVLLRGDSGRTYTQSLTPSGAIGGGGGTTTTTGNALPSTGMDSNSLLGLWVGGGALVLAGGAVAVAAAVRRQRQNADA